MRLCRPGIGSEKINGEVIFPGKSPNMLHIYHYFLRQKPAGGRNRIGNPRADAVTGGESPSGERRTFAPTGPRLAAAYRRFHRNFNDIFGFDQKARPGPDGGLGVFPGGPANRIFVSAGTLPHIGGRPDRTDWRRTGGLPSGFIPVAARCRECRGWHAPHQILALPMLRPQILMTVMS